MLGSKDELEQHHLAVAAGPPLGVVDVGGHPVQDGGADDLRVAQRRHDLIVQKPANLSRAGTQSSLSHLQLQGCPSFHPNPIIIHFFLTVPKKRVLEERSPCPTPTGVKILHIFGQHKANSLCDTSKVTSADRGYSLEQARKRGAAAVCCGKLLQLEASNGQGCLTSFIVASIACLCTPGRLESAGCLGNSTRIIYQLFSFMQPPQCSS